MLIWSIIYESITYNKIKKQLMSRKYLICKFKPDEFSPYRKTCYEILQVGKEQVQLKEITFGYITTRDISSIADPIECHYEILSELP